MNLQEQTDYYVERLDQNLPVAVGLIRSEEADVYVDIDFGVKGQGYDPNILILLPKGSPVQSVRIPMSEDWLRRLLALLNALGVPQNG
jgi:hypothetical protein